MTSQEILDTIQKHSLTVRCLPFEVVNYWTYKEGDENKKYVNSKGNPIESKKEVVIQQHDLEYFKNTPYNGIGYISPEERYKRWIKQFPNGRKLLKETKIVKNGGWWYVKETKNTDSTIRFNREYDKFFAPTLEEAISLYIESIKY